MSSLRVPVDRLDVRLVTASGARADVTLFQAPGASLEDLFESDEPFLPVLEASQIRLYARRSLACVTRGKGEIRTEEESLPYQRRRVAARLSCGVVIEGFLCYLAEDSQGRPADFLNQRARSFALHEGSWIHQIAKLHVEHVDGA